MLPLAWSNKGMPTDPHLSRQIGTGLAAAMSDHTWTDSLPAITAVYRRTPDYKLEDLGTLKVSVVPGPVAVNQANERAPRGCDFFEITLGVVIAKHVGSEDDIADLEDLNQAILDAIRSHIVEPEDAPEGTDWSELALPMPYDRDALQDRNVFMSQIEVTYLVPKDKVAAPPAVLGGG